jgi:DNA-directed RNA polymerase subunit RPC12/RpoP
MTSTSCNRCRAETEITIVNFADGEADPLRIRLKEFPLRTCPEGHRQFLRPDFAAELLQHLTEEDEPQLPAGEEKGLIMKKYLCESCGQSLEPKPDHRHTFSIEVELSDLDPFGVDLSMPVYKCSACGKEQLHSLKEVRKLTPAAMAHAFEAADIPPPPGVI